MVRRPSCVTSGPFMIYRFLSILPSHLHPNTGLLPDNWEDYEVDPRIPDVSEWEPVQIRDFFSQKGFSDALSDVFLHQVCNMLLMS